MKIRVLGGSGGLVPGHLLTSFLIDEHVILDAGSMAAALSLDEQNRIDHILLTHAHLDHSGTVPFFVDNVFGTRQEPVRVYALPHAVGSVKEHLFNNSIWPDFSMIPDLRRAIVRFEALDVEKPTRIGDLTVHAVLVHHTVPAVGFLVEDGGATVLFSGDTGPTERLWELANQTPNLRAAFVETSFPNRMQDIADASGHLTPQTLAVELRKLRRSVPIYIYHIKPRFHHEVVEEIRSIDRRGIEIVSQGAVYQVGEAPPAG